MKPEIGKINALKVVRTVGIGMFLDGGELGDILLPNSAAPKGQLTGTTLDVFIYRDSEDRLVATTRFPLVQVGHAAVLRVKQTNPKGAFLDWGLPKDLLVPHKEQKVEMQEGRSYLVYVYLDEVSQRVVATTRLNRFLNQRPGYFQEGQEVDLMIGHGNELGFVTLIGEEHFGMLYRNEIFRKIVIGERCKGYIKCIRPDGKIDLSLQKPGEDIAPDLGEQILAEMRKNNGFLMMNDYTPPVIIYKRFGVSKKVFKKAVAILYSQRRITIEKLGIRIVAEAPAAAE